MEKFAYVILPLFLIVLVFRTKQDLYEYNQFKKLKSTKSRQSKFMEWILWSFGLFGVGSILGLALVGKLGLITKPSAELINLIPDPASLSSVSNGDRGSFIAGILTSVILTGVFVSILLNKNKSKNKVPIIGDVQAMLPRNSTERFWAALMAINAGFSEELFFRLLLPVLFLLVSGSAHLAVLLAVITFGLVHWYQGKVGVVFTTLLGAGLMYLYLRTGNILAVMALHAAIDLNSLVLQPLIRGLIKSRSK